MGMVPVWGMHNGQMQISGDIRVAPPAFVGSLNAGTLDSSLTASGAIIVDFESGQTIYSRTPGTARPMASLTKLMTALIIVENHDLDEVVTVPADIDNVDGTVAHLPAGEKFTVADLLSALLIMSANDAAVTFSLHHSGTMEEFAEEMNERAAELGLKDTIYQNSTGLDEPTQQSSPQDLAWLAMFVMRNPVIAERMGTPTMQIRSLSGKSLTLVHTHQLLRSPDSSIFAGKTGTTDAAGQCLLSIIESDGRRYIAVLLHSRDRYADMRMILNTLTD